jgi:hypothetical protein
VSRSRLVQPPVAVASKAFGCRIFVRSSFCSLMNLDGDGCFVGCMHIM